MNETRKALELAREAIDELSYCSSSHAADDIKSQAIAAIDAALSAPAAPVARADGMPENRSERHLRRLLAARVAMPGMYGDDGEAHGTEHGISIDFMREHVAAIEAKLWALNAARAPAPAAPVAHADDLAVDSLAAAMKAKLADARAKGRSGWQTCRPEVLSEMLRDHVEKGDVRDVANFCAFLWSLGSGITAPLPGSEAFDRWVDAGMGLQPAPAAPVAQGIAAGRIAQPYTLAEIRERIASHDYSAELLLQHAMLLLDKSAQPVSEPSDAEINKLACAAGFSPGMVVTDNGAFGRFARAVLALRPASVPPLTEERIAAAVATWFDYPEVEQDDHQARMRRVLASFGIGQGGA